MRRLLPAVVSLLALAVLAGGCGTQKIALSPSDPNYQGAVLFNQRCSGCHTLSYAATHGSAANIRSAEFNNGPNFDVRCERPVTRVLYAIENGGFSGAIMPQNIVVGPQALEVARFVATYAGRRSPNVPGVPPCDQEAIGAIPTLTATGAGAAASTTTSTATTTTAAASTASGAGAYSTGSTAKASKGKGSKSAKATRKKSGKKS